MPELDLKTIPLIVGVRFTRTIKMEDINLQLFDLDFEGDYEESLFTKCQIEFLLEILEGCLRKIKYEYECRV